MTQSKSIERVKATKKKSLPLADTVYAKIPYSLFEEIADLTPYYLCGTLKSSQLCVKGKHHEAR